MDTPLRVDLPGRAYDIHIAIGACATAGPLIASWTNARRALVIADALVAECQGPALRHSLEGAGLEVALATFAAGERHKTVATAETLWQACAKERLDRSGAIVALGGGVTGDLAGFVAATWMRGIAFVQVPTTLLAMVDSSVGGKTGVNTAAGKNLVGAFHQPAGVIADPATLATLPPREYRAGLAEVVKYGVICDPDFLAWQASEAAGLRHAAPDRVARAVRTSCGIKARYVIADEREGGVRAHLNYGHTFGHALEAGTGYTTYLHGEAVAIGMTMAADLAARLGLLEEPDLIDRQVELLAALGLPTYHVADDPEAEASKLADLCRLDKKVRRGRVRFVLPRAAGRVELVTDPDPQAVVAAFRARIQAR